MPTYLERYLAGEREEVWAELSARGPAIRAEPLFAEAQAVARETMTRARANVALLVQRLTSLGYRFVSDALGPRPTPYVSPSGESLAALRELEHQYGPLPLSIETWYEVVGAVDLMGVYPRLSTFEGMGAEGYIDMLLGGERIRIRSEFPFYVQGAPPSMEPFDPDAGIAADPLVVWPCIDALVDELELPTRRMLAAATGRTSPSATRAWTPRSRATIGRGYPSSATCARRSPGADSLACARL